jgi:hypothetical protein
MNAGRLCVLLSAAAGLAVSTTGPAGEPDTAVEAPGVELLEFLGTWTDADGEWLDPTMFEDPIHAGGEEGEGDYAD